MGRICSSLRRGNRRGIMTRMQVMAEGTIGPVMNWRKGDIIGSAVNQDPLGLTPEEVKPHVKQQKKSEIPAMWWPPPRPQEALLKIRAVRVISQQLRFLKMAGHHPHRRQQRRLLETAVTGPSCASGGSVGPEARSSETTAQIHTAAGMEGGRRNGDVHGGRERTKTRSSAKEIRETKE